jgi:hypothetical protein
MYLKTGFLFVHHTIQETLMRLFISIIAISLFAGCSVNPSEVSSDYAKEFISKATYVKDSRTGLCYAIVATRMTGKTDQNGVSFTWVPCEQVAPFLVK